MVKRTLKNYNIKGKQRLNMFRELNKKDFLKQGGQINRNVDTIISEFLSKQI